jgi:aspartate/methionine/tyrosine aminotransferase
VNPRLATIEPSLIRAIAAKKTPGAIDLGLGEPTLLPQARFIEAATRWAGEFGLKYTVNAGDAATRARIAAHYAYPGMALADNVCMMTGSQEAVYVTIKALLDPAVDEMLVVEPAFPAYLKMAQLEGIAARAVSLRAQTGFAYDVDAILAAVGPRTRLIVIGSPANPTGRVITLADTRRLARELGARGGSPIWVLHDEIYRELTYVDDAGYVAAEYPYTIVANSLSKSNALTGLRIGWVIAPSPAIEAIVKTHAWITSTASAFAQRVAYEIFGEPGALTEQARWYAQQRAGVVAALRESPLEFIEPDGAFYACVRLPHGSDSLAAGAQRVAVSRAG